MTYQLLIGLNAQLLSSCASSLSGPPSPDQPIRQGNVLHNLTGTLSDCIYQSLTGMTQENVTSVGARDLAHKNESSTVASGD